MAQGRSRKKITAVANQSRDSSSHQQRENQAMCNANPWIPAQSEPNCKMLLQIPPWGHPFPVDSRLVAGSVPAGSETGDI